MHTLLSRTDEAVVSKNDVHDEHKARFCNTYSPGLVLVSLFCTIHTAIKRELVFVEASARVLFSAPLNLVTKCLDTIILL